MSTFSYVARDTQGRRISGTLSGPSEQAVLAELQSRQLAPVRVEPMRERRGLRRRVGTRQLATAYRQLADLLRAGVPLLRGLQLLGRGRAAPRLAQVMQQVADQVADGRALADALAEHPDVFPDVQLAMVRAGERGSFLDQVLERLAGFLEQQADLRGKVAANLAYPVLLLGAGLCVVTWAMVYLVPKFESFYEGLDELPVPTRILLATSRVLSGGWPYVLLGLAVTIVVVWWLQGRPAVRRWWAGAKLRLPRLGPLLRDLAVGRFARMLGTLLDNGIPLLTALRISRDAAGNLRLAEAVDEAAESVRRGESLAEPLARCGLLSEDAVEIISVGEAANNLPQVLVALADAFEKRIDRQLTTFVRLMEPLLIMMLGGVVFFLFLALVVPMLKISASF
jgi:general secretion pathway protein F/type IV pilus assembly protein PilC